MPTAARKIGRPTPVKVYARDVAVPEICVGRRLERRAQTARVRTTGVLADFIAAVVLRFTSSRVNVYGGVVNGICAFRSRGGADYAVAFRRRCRRGALEGRRQARSISFTWTLTIWPESGGFISQWHAVGSACPPLFMQDRVRR